MTVQQTANKAADDLMLAALRKKRWTKEQGELWTRAYNALVKLAKS